MRLGVRVPSLGPPERDGLAESRTQTRSMGLKRAHIWTCSSVGRAPNRKAGVGRWFESGQVQRQNPLRAALTGTKTMCRPPSYRPAKKVRAGHLAALPKGQGDDCGKTLCREQATPGEICRLAVERDGGGNQRSGSSRTISDRSSWLNQNDNAR